MIVRVQESHVPSIVPLAAKFYAEAGLPGTPDEDHFARSLLRVLRDGTGFGFAAVDSGGRVSGGILGLRTVDFVTGDPYVQELAWFTDPEKRGDGIRLFRRFEEHSRRLGVKRIFFVHMESINADILHRFYERQGYKPLERTYWKELI